MKQQIIASRETVAQTGSITGYAILDHSYEDLPLKLSGKESWVYNEYDGQDKRQKMALGVVWHAKCTQPIRHDYTLRSDNMADLLQTAMVAAYEPYTLRDQEAVWFRKYRNADGELITEARSELSALTPEELEDKFVYKHIERAVRKQVKFLLDLKGKEVAPPQTETDADDFDSITASRVYDEYLVGEGTEFDKLDKLLAHCGEYLNDGQMAQLKGLVAGTAKLSDVGSLTREAIRKVVIGTLHLRA